MTPPDQTDGPPATEADPTDDDLAVHAVLDGEATAAQRRRVAGDPHLRSRVTEMKAVVNQVASPPKAPGDDVFDAIRAAAVAHIGDPEEVLDLRDSVDADDQGVAVVADDEGEEVDAGDEGDPAPPAEVVPLERRSGAEPVRRRRRWPALPAVAAIVVLLVALGVGLIVTDSDDPSADLTAADSQTEDQAQSDGDSSGGAASPDDEARQESAESPAATTTAPGAAGDVATDAGELEPQASFPDDAALREVLQEVDPATLVLLPGQEGFTEGNRADNLRRAAATEIIRCGTVLESSDPTIGPVQAATVVEVDGEKLFVLSSPVSATDSTPAATLLHVVDPVSCVPRFAVQR